MTDEQIIKLANQAGCVQQYEDSDNAPMFTKATLRVFARLVRNEALEEAKPSFSLNEMELLLRWYTHMKIGNGGYVSEDEIALSKKIIKALKAQEKK